MSVPEKVLEWAERQPEGTPFGVKHLIALGSPEAIYQALTRLTKAGKVRRATRGLYVLTRPGRFGPKPISVKKVVEAVGAMHGEPLIVHGAVAANELGLTTQIPAREVYLVAGRPRMIKVGRQVIEFRHAPQWQLQLGNSAAGHAVRALAWLGPKNAEEVAPEIARRLSKEQLKAIEAVQESFPLWMVRAVKRVAEYV